MKAPNGRLLATVLSRLADTGGDSGAVTPKSFLRPQKFLLLRKTFFKHMIKTKCFPTKNVFCLPQTLKPGYGPVCAKIVSAIRIFCFEGHSSSRCSIT